MKIRQWPCAVLVLCIFIACSRRDIRREGIHPRPAPRAETLRILVEAYRAGDSLSLRVALQIAESLRSAVSYDRVYVIPKLDLSEPIVRPLPWSEVRELAKLVRADAVVDVLARETPEGFEIEVHRLTPPATGEPVLLLRIRKARMVDAVKGVTAKLVTDTMLYRKSAI